MADDAPKATAIKLTNDGEGPRSFFNAKGEPVVLRPGESFEGDILAADVADLSSDLRQGDEPEAEAQPEPEGPVSLDGLDKDGLLAQARAEGFTSIADQPELGEEEIRAAIALARETRQSTIQAEADALSEANKVPQLREIAKAEGVAVESDANKGTIAFAIAHARYLKAQG